LWLYREYLEVVSGADFMLSGDQSMERVKSESDSKEYLELRKEMLTVPSKYNISLEYFLNR